MTRPDSSDLPLAVARIRDRHGAVVGAGFLAGPAQLLTCAHVLDLAGAGPGERVRVSFPWGDEELHGTVAKHWWAADCGDVALVRLDATPPGARTLALGSAVGSRSHSVSAFGFPGQAPS